MPITRATMNGLFAKSRNRCAIPECRATLVVGDTIVAEICHIRARRKGGARFDSTLNEEQKNAAVNLILLCPTCHTLADKDKTGNYSVEQLLEFKAEQERVGVFEISAEDARRALAILEKHNAKNKRPVTKSSVSGEATARAGDGGVAMAFVGNKFRDLNVRVSEKKVVGKYPSNSIGADANMSGYIDELCGLYVAYKKNTGEDEAILWAKISKAIKRAFRLKQKTRNHIPAERFWDVVEFLTEKLRETPVGKKHIRNRTKLCSSFDEWRTTKR